MEIFLVIFIFLILLLGLFCITNIKLYIEFANVSACNILKIKVYIFSFLLVFRIKKEIKNENKKKNIKEKIDTAIDYLIKSKSDPVDFAKKKVKDSEFIPDMIKRFDFSKIHLEKMDLNLCLDFNNAAFSAVGTGIVNAIISMVIAKYANNIDGPVNYRVFPGYSGNGVKVEVLAKIRVKAIEIIKLLFNRGGKENERTSN